MRVRGRGRGRGGGGGGEGEGRGGDEDDAIWLHVVDVNLIIYLPAAARCR